MARSHARVLTSIWADGDFCGMSPRARETYLFLLSQPDLEHSGLIGLRLERWADDLAGTEPEDIRAALEELGNQRFVVVDWRKQEVLVRSLIRRDDVWKQPNVFKSAAGSIRAVRSPLIRAALLAELIRLDLAAANKDVITLRDELVDELSKGSPNPSVNPSGMPSADPSANGSPDPSLRGQGKGSTGSTTVRAPSPALFPAPQSPAVPPPAAADDGEPNPGPIVAAFVEGSAAAGLKRPGANIIARVGKQARQMLAEGTYTPDELIASARNMGSGEWNDLAVQARKDDAAVNGRAGAAGQPARESTAMQRARAGAEAGRRVQAMIDGGTTQ